MAQERPFALVVEDDEFTSVGTEVLLEDLGFRTVAEATPQAALEHLRADRTIDVLVADLGLGKDAQAGLVLAMEAVTIRPDLAVVYVSGRGVTPEIRASLVKRSEFVSKPYTPAQLKAAVEAALAKPR